MKIVRIIRLISLSVLFAGSAAIVFAAITLVKAAEATGISVTEAATRNAPLFIQFSNITIVCAFLLLLAESIDFAVHKNLSKLALTRYIASGLCIAACIVFSFGIIPPMKALLPQISSDPAAHAQFTKLHSMSRGVFGASILFALISLIIPVTGKKES